MSMLPADAHRRLSTAPPPPPRGWSWNECARICNAPRVDEAIRALLADQTDDNAICMVRAVLEEQRNG